MQAWIWAVIGLSAIIAEMFVPSFFVIFFGIAAMLVAALTYARFTTGYESQLLVFTTTAIALMFLLRAKYKAILMPVSVPPDYIGKKVVVSESIAPGKEGRVLYLGSEWTASCDGAGTIEKDSTVIITGIEGLTFKVKRA